MRIHLAAILVLLALAGCASRAEQQAANDGADSARCASMGFIAGTDGFANCRLELANQRIATQTNALSKFMLLRQLQRP